MQNTFFSRVALVLVGLLILAAATVTPVNAGSIFDSPPDPQPKSVTQPAPARPSSPEIPRQPLSPPAAPLVAPAPGLEPGLVAELFQDTSFTTLAKKRIDRQIYFEWVNAGPDPDMTGGRFSIRWTGILQVPKTATYTLFAAVDDEIEIRIDNNLIMSQHRPSNAAEDRLLLTAGLHRIRIDYRNIGSEGHLMLQWEQSDGFPRQGLGRDALWHERAVAGGAAPAAPGWLSHLITSAPMGDPFREDAPPQTVLVGFELSKFNDGGHVIRSVRAIYRGDSGDVMGTQFGVPSEEVVRLVAKPGYAVGTIRAHHGDRIDGLLLHFMRLRGNDLVPGDAYDSDSFGGTGGHEIEVGEGRPVTGIYGVSRKEFHELGLITRE